MDDRKALLNIYLLTQDEYCTALTDRPFWQVAGEEWGENGKDWVEKVGKENGDCFSCSYDGVVGRPLLFFYPVNGIWLITKCSP